MRRYKDGQIIRENQELEIILFRLFLFIVEWFCVEIQQTP